ncbi:hypothetical protein [Clostridium beijerinckii]|uniref:hypothetical protein n=1 Tax=Clostridium beijerinckii TaxID=1520 RepID=UPI00031F0BD9|nr:hypothetical protein [Clostridium beijerinckii]
MPNISSLTDGYPIAVKFNVASTGNITLNVNGYGAKNVVDYYGNIISDVRANLIANLRFEINTNSFILAGKSADGTALASDLLVGKKATTKLGKITGTIPDRGQYSSPGTSAAIWSDRLYYRFPAGYYHGGNYDGNGGVAEAYIPYADVANLVGITPDKIVTGNNILGVSGTGGGYSPGSTVLSGNIDLKFNQKWRSADSAYYESGNYVCGDGNYVYCYYSMSSMQDCLVVKYDLNGNVIWKKILVISILRCVQMD